MSKRVKGTLVIIGGAERKDDEQTVLKVVADRIHRESTAADRDGGFL